MKAQATSVAPYNPSPLCVSMVKAPAPRDFQSTPHAPSLHLGEGVLGVPGLPSTEANGAGANSHSFTLHFGTWAHFLWLL